MPHDVTYELAAMYEPAARAAPRFARLYVEWAECHDVKGQEMRPLAANAGGRYILVSQHTARIALNMEIVV